MYGVQELQVFATQYPGFVQRSNSEAVQFFVQTFESEDETVQTMYGPTQRKRILTPYELFPNQWRQMAQLHKLPFVHQHWP